jgi:radical SAM superfamily enzyme YgiQ (UPF0313 family)
VAADILQSEGVNRKDLLARERGTVRKKWTGRVPVCVVFPDTYYIGMSNLAVHLLYDSLNSRDDIVCERAFFSEVGPLLSVESGRPLSAFEIVFFTLSFEMNYPNVPKMLEAGGLAAEAAQRGKESPIVVGGGICVMANPEPVSSFFDLLLLGDVEACLDDFVEEFLAKKGTGRSDLVDALSGWKWAYNPRYLSVSYGDDGVITRFDPPDYRREITRYRRGALATSIIESPDTEFADMLLVEGTRGCPSRCSFCLAGNIYPFIYDKLEKIHAQEKEIGIIGGGVSYHPHLADVIRNIEDSGGHVHLPSLRLDEVPIEIIDLLKGSIKTLTFGIEAGTENLRRCLGKPITDDEIFSRLEAIAELKSFHFKFYFMVGLPGETRADIEAIPTLIKRVLHVLVKKGSGKGRIGSITVHVSPFVPKPATPFQWLPMADMQDLKEKIGILKREIGKIANTHFTHDSIKHSFIQGVLARGDRRVKDIILQFSRGLNLAQVMRESPLNLNFYATRARGIDEVFPWDFIGSGAEKSRLRRRLAACLPDSRR